MLGDHLDRPVGGGGWVHILKLQPQRRLQGGGGGRGGWDGHVRIM